MIKLIHFCMFGQQKYMKIKKLHWQYSIVSNLLKPGSLVRNYMLVSCQTIVYSCIDIVPFQFSGFFSDIVFKLQLCFGCCIRIDFTLQISPAKNHKKNGIFSRIRAQLRCDQTWNIRIWPSFIYFLGFGLASYGFVLELFEFFP